MLINIYKTNADVEIFAAFFCLFSNFDAFLDNLQRITTHGHLLYRYGHAGRA